MGDEYEVIWSERAGASFRDIIKYLAARNPPAADTLGGDIIIHGERLRGTPHLGPV